MQLSEQKYDEDFEIMRILLYILDCVKNKQVPNLEIYEWSWDRSKLFVLADYLNEEGYILGYKSVWSKDGCYPSWNPSRWGVLKKGIEFLDNKVID